MDNSGWNAWVFRDGRKLVEGKWLISGLRESLSSLGRSADRERILEALLWAGELECAISDAHAQPQEDVCGITDALASELVSLNNLDTLPLLQRLESIHLPGSVNVSVPESFAYYALHPLRFAALADGLELHSGAVAVVGIRSIGTTLSAVVLAALRKRGVRAHRITVRPTGHPYDRRLDFNAKEREWVAANTTATFLIVDEGPGLSGSSFISVGEALAREGVKDSDIIFCGTRCPDPHALRTPNAASRWTRFRSAFTGDEPFLPEAAAVPIGGGAWRERFLSPDQRPGSWTQLESLKYLSSDHRLLFRFEGYGRYGADVGRRSKRLGNAGFAPPYMGNEEGFGIYEFVAGRAATRNDLSAALLDRFAEYCAFRSRAFSVDCPQDPDLERMMRFDWKNEFGVDLDGDARLRGTRIVVCDGRLLPHEWLLADDGRILKLDAATHGDDHFFPGPCDIAWDVAGTIIEWELDRRDSQRFLQHYEELSGDRISSRLGAYLLAYGIFRCSYAKMATKAMGGTPEEALLHRDYMHYRQICENLNAALSDAKEVRQLATQALSSRLADEPAAA